MAKLKFIFYSLLLYEGIKCEIMEWVNAAFFDEGRVSSCRRRRRRRSLDRPKTSLACATTRRERKRFAARLRVVSRPSQSAPRRDASSVMTLQRPKAFVGVRGRKTTHVVCARGPCGVGGVRPGQARLACPRTWVSYKRAYAPRTGANKGGGENMRKCWNSYDTHDR
jgi:hypothetical protein